MGKKIEPSIMLGQSWCDCAYLRYAPDVLCKDIGFMAIFGKLKKSLLRLIRLGVYSYGFS